MRRTISVIILLAFVFVLSGCKNNTETHEPMSSTEVSTNTEAPVEPAANYKPQTETSDVRIDYGSSDVYSKEDMDVAIGMINDKFAKWRGSVVHSIRYGGDDKNIEDNIVWANDCIEGQNFTEVMEFETDFHSPTEVSGEWGDSDTEYDDYQWWFARADGGDWKLFYWSY